MAIITQDNKVKYLGTEIDIKTDVNGTRFVDLTNTNTIALAKFGHKMELTRWQSFCRTVRDLFRSLCCCCRGVDDDLSYLADLAEKARAKLKQAPLTNREISLVQTKKGPVLIIGNRPAALQERAAANGSPPSASPERAAEVAPKPYKTVLQNLARAYDSGDTEFTVQRIEKNGTAYFHIKHATLYPLLNVTRSDSFEVPVSQLFKGTQTVRPGSVDYVKLLCDEMGPQWKAGKPAQAT